MMNALHEECGVFGIFDRNNLAIAPLTYYGLFALQHRGQESCGIAINDDGFIRCHKDMGLVSEVFSHDILDRMKGTISIGHVRYSTAGGSVFINAQPLVTQYVKGTLSLAHNGNLTNAISLRKKLEDEGAIFQTTVDSEVIAYLIAKERTHTPSVEEAVESVMHTIQGGYALLVMSPRKLIAARDPYGFKPLCMGRIEDSIVFASETCALDAAGAKFIRDVLPGEIVVCDESGVRSIKTHCVREANMCIFEYIYFARPDSRIDGKSVYEARIKAGRLLYQQHPVEADVVIGVPESGLDAASGFSEESGIPLVRGFVKNSYIGRTFIKPKQTMRSEAVRIKLNPVESAVAGKRVVMIDDSIVRGTTIANIVRMLKDAGATEVHVRISSPPFMHPCFYGTDVPSSENLIACQHSVDEIAAIIGADSLGYLDVTTLGEMIGDKDHHFCDACFTGVYPNRETGIDLLEDEKA
ncbi:MAG TPA: amidophosphoribosyltransferase [Bacillota bacterium]|nr:amidophosphoribosyltransferase [Bacillota bacterium]HPE38468.1 amidophosphoribosyltransferase [Bacillota bacterium]